MPERQGPNNLDFIPVNEQMGLDSGPSKQFGQAKWMSRQNDEKMVVKQRRDQMLKLVTKGFYNELINYGVQKDEILRVASHLLDNLMAQQKKPGDAIQYYNRIFTLETVKDEWKQREQW